MTVHSAGGECSDRHWFDMHEAIFSASQHAMILSLACRSWNATVALIEQSLRISAPFDGADEALDSVLGGIEDDVVVILVVAKVSPGINPRMKRNVSKQIGNNLRCMALESDVISMNFR